MKAMVYLTETRDGWRPRWTVAWDIDERFWLDPAFCRGVLEGAGVAAEGAGVTSYTAADIAEAVAAGVVADVAAGMGADVAADVAANVAANVAAGISAGVAADGHPIGGTRLAVLRSPLPLGIAEAATAWLAEGGTPDGEKGRKRIWRAMAGMGPASRRAMAGMEPAPRRETDGGKVWALRRLVRAANVCRAAADALTGRSAAERAAGAEAPYWSLDDTAVLGPEGRWRTENAEVRRDRGHRLGRLARRASACLAGRSLLPEEAQRLFADTLPELMPGEWLAVVQTAHLLGLVELRAALAPPAPYGHRHRERQGLASRAFWASWAWRTLRANLPFRRRESLRCRRCGGGEAGMLRTPCASCGRICAVCETCLTMGRCRECELLIVGKPAQAQDGAGTGLRMPAILARNPADWLDKWNLSPAQREASAQALSFIWRTLGRTSFEGGSEGGGCGNGHFRPDRSGGGPGPQSGGRPTTLPDGQLVGPTGGRPADPAGERRFLLWAVTGAGKTEMLFPLLESVLAAGGRALVATPRRDVVLELAPRLARAFGEEALSVRYGGSPDRKSVAPLTLATTHQLLRFQEAFDLVVIDELDAFPYHGDPMLQFAAAKARKANGVTVLLTATPPQALQREVRRGRLPCAKVPARYHGHPLPEPRRLPLPELARMLRAGRLPRRLLQALRRSVDADRSLFVFVPYIRQAEALASLLRAHAAALGLDPGRIAGTSSQDPDREAKVQAFRQRDVRLLVATTILERGVTVPRSDVFILDADHAMFDETALVQMAGRAGRSADAPEGRVCFCGRSMTAAQRRAIRHIRGMNRLARRKGYLLPPPACPHAPRNRRSFSLFRIPVRGLRR